MVLDVGDDADTGRPSVLLSLTRTFEGESTGLLSFECSKEEAYDWAQRLYCPVRITVELESDQPIGSG